MKSKKWLGMVGIIFIIAGFLSAQTIAKKQIGKAGDWRGTIAAVALNNQIFTIESSGSLYATDPGSGSWKQIGKKDFANTAFLFAGDKKLYSIEKDGSLYGINPADGSWKQAGKAGDWKGTIAGVCLAGQIYTVESGGALYVTNPDTGVWKQIGKPDFANTQFILAGDKKLYTIEKSGSLYAVSPVDGSWKQVGKPGDWKNSLAGAGLGGQIYTVERSGALYATDPVTGVWKQLGQSELANTRVLFAGVRKLYTIDANGSLFEVEVAEVKTESKPEVKTGAISTTSSAAVAGNLTFKLLGKWQGDSAAFAKDTDYQKQIAANPEMAKGILSMLSTMSMEVTLDGITVNIMGEKTGPVKYVVISSSGNTLVIADQEGPHKGEMVKFIFIDNTHIKMVDKDNKAMYLKKI